MEARGVRMISARHEAAAVSMADGIAQAGGGVGVCTVTCGPGLLHTVTPLLGAARGDVPLVLFAGDLPAATRRGNPQDVDQRQVADLCEAAFVQVASPATAVDAVRRAFTIARVERRPVVLNAPMDVQAAEYPATSGTAPVGAAAVVRVGSDPAVRLRVVELIQASRRPVILAGRGAIRSGADRELLALAERIGALVTTTMPAKGWLDEDPFAVGVVGPLRSAVAEELLAEADLVLAFGSTLDRYTRTEGGVVFPTATVVSVNTDAGPRPPHPPADLYLTGDARRTAQELLDDLDAGFRQEGFRTAELQHRLQTAGGPPTVGDGSPMDPRDVMRTLEGHLGPNHDVVVGVGHFLGFPVLHLRRPTGGHFLFCHYSGSIGYALPTGIGAAVANPDRTVVVVEGDGSLMQYVQELDTAARLGLRLLVVVVNDGAFGAELFKMRHAGVESASAVIPTPSFDDVARALGADGAVAADAPSLDKALTEFGASGGVYVIDARVDREAMSEMYRKLLLGEPNRAPHQRETKEVRP
jgi:thiamine pyrophosphate-dependent acetolactate synthase large subunit-like protein